MFAKTLVIGLAFRLDTGKAEATTTQTQLVACSQWVPGMSLDCLGMSSRSSGLWVRCYCYMLQRILASSTGSHSHIDSDADDTSGCHCTCHLQDRLVRLERGV